MMSATCCGYRDATRATFSSKDEQSRFFVDRMLEKLGIPRATSCRCYDLYRTGGPEALSDRSPRPDRVWNRIPHAVRERIIKLALDEPTLSPRERAVRFTDTENYFVSAALREVVVLAM